MTPISTLGRWLALTLLLLAGVGADLAVTGHHRKELPPAVYTFQVSYPESRDDDVADVLDSDMDDSRFSKTQDDWSTMTWEGKTAAVKWIAADAEDGLGNYVGVYATNADSCDWEAVARRLQKDMARIPGVVLKPGFVHPASIDCDHQLDAATTGARLAGGPATRPHARGRGRTVEL